MPNGFNQACPSGNIMVDTYHEPKIVECGRCEGKGTHNWNDLEDYVEELSFRVYKLKKTGNEPKSFRELMKLARKIKDEGSECGLCDGTGEVEA